MIGDFELEVALYSLGETIVELITSTTESGLVYEFWRDSGNKFFHVVFEVAGIRESMAALETARIRFEHDGS
jgi:methylmalonyl-CoA/ethylmalonyl-CoA epimerase